MQIHLQIQVHFRGGPLEQLRGGGGGGTWVTENIIMPGRIARKNPCTTISLELKENHAVTFRTFSILGDPGADSGGG